MQDTHTRSDVLSKQIKIKNLLKQYKLLIQCTDGAGLEYQKHMGYYMCVKIFYDMVHQVDMIHVLLKAITVHSKEYVKKYAENQNTFEHLNREKNDFMSDDEYIQSSTS